MRTETIASIRDNYRIIGSAIDHASHVNSLLQDKKSGECFLCRMDISQDRDEFKLKSTC
jgi:hypothetical protein